MNRKNNPTAAGTIAHGALLGAMALTFNSVITPVQGQSPDALIDKLVQKGILTTDEAKQLRQEAEKDAKKAAAPKTIMPDWVTALKFNGDFRARYEGTFADNPAFSDRNRYRYRLRFGVTATLLDDFEIGFRLASGDSVNGFSNNSGNPLSNSSTFQDNGSKKFVYIDLAYAKWAPIHTTDWTAAFTFGKMEMPFVFSHVVFDPDYTPEGLAAQFAYNLSEQHTLKLNLAGFVLDELSGSSHDPLFMGAQLRLDSKWSKKIATSVGVSGLGITSVESLSNGNVPNVNRGNTRDAAGAPTYNFNPIVADASVTYTLDHFPGYAGPFPIKVGGEYLNNPAAPDNNYAYTVGVIFGKAGKKGLWELSYAYRYIGADSWYEELPDDDFGAFYQVQQPNAGFNAPGAGYGGGTNVRGHVVKASYSLYNFMTIGLTYYYGTLIHPSPSGSDSDASHVMADLVWKF